ncbi:hypothetical protein CBL_00257 [Carabus blaptoides fortunei]
MAFPVCLPVNCDSELSPFEVYLEPTARELMEALRALFIQTHWHSFTILADDSVISSVLLRRELVAILEAPPLHPTLVQLPALKQPQALFRRLADVARSTRGVVILMCDRPAAGRVLFEARRLNMVDGHFVWLWIDTEPLNFSATSAASTEKPPTSDIKRERRETPEELNDHRRFLMNATHFKMLDQNPDEGSFNEQKTSTTEFPTDSGEKDDDVHSRKVNFVQPQPASSSNQQFRREKRNNILQQHREFVKSDISDMHLNYLIKNDQFLLFNRQNGVEGSKSKYLRDSVVSAKKKSLKRYDRKRKEEWPELPVGLLSIRALPMKVDRHLVKGAVRLLVGTLRTVLARCPDWLAQSIALEDLTTSCWTPVSASEFNFSAVFSRSPNQYGTLAFSRTSLAFHKCPPLTKVSLVHWDSEHKKEGDRESDHINPLSPHPTNALICFALSLVSSLIYEPGVKT